ncbi:MAG: hypothetical protein QW600_01140 [Candidatus Bathyarchaeia archaeon]|nr:hypothetical protein [Candidatus Bathyarchaeota archaeon]
MDFTMREGLWLKGSIHCHSTMSDGLLSPDEVARFYGERGYNFLSITDHEKISCVKYFRGVYQFGVEVSRGKGRLNEPYHIVVLGVNDDAILKINDAQLLIDYVNDSGGIAFIAHPYWSNLVYEDLAQLEGYIGIEIYNFGCDVEVAKGYGLAHWDSLLSSNRRVWGMAVDDSHRYFRLPIDADGGWIWINAYDESPEGVLKSIRDGRFYSSMSPKVFSFRWTPNLLHVESTPIDRLNIITANGRGLSISLTTIFKLLEEWRRPRGREMCENIIADLDYISDGEKQKVYVELVRGGEIMVEFSGEGATVFRVEREFNYPYIRVELLDREGKYAWINPILKL